MVTRTEYTGSDMITNKSLKAARPKTVSVLAKRKEGNGTTAVSPRNVTAHPKSGKRHKQDQKKQPQEERRKWWSSRYVIFIIGCSVVGLYVAIVIAFCGAFLWNGSNVLQFWQHASLANPLVPGNSVQYVMIPPGNERSDEPLVLSNRMPHGAYWGSHPDPDSAAHERRIRGELRNAQFGQDALLTSDGRVLLDTLPRLKQSVSFQMGRIGDVTYYHCSYAYGPPTPEHGDMPTENIVVPRASVSRDLVLLNGQRFFGKEIRENALGGDLKLTDEQVGEHAWAQYCQSLSHSGPTAKIDNLVALELDLAASPSTVRQVLRALYYDHRLAALPVAALVTPEAATKTIVDWVVYGDVTAPSLQRLARHWIPVAAGTYFVQAMEDDQDSAHDLDNISSEAHASVPLPKRSVFSSLDGWPVLSVFGVGDPESEQAAHRLREEIASASALKLRGGGRACYLQYPEDFLAEIQRYLEVDEARNAPDSATTL